MDKFSFLKLFFILCLSSYSLAQAAHTSTEKILYHLHNTDKNSYRRAISNLENLYKGMSNHKLDIKVLLQGDSIKLLDFSVNNNELNQRFSKLINNGVSIEVSRENFEKNHHLFDGVSPPKQVQNIFTRIIELQKQGYHYITP